MEPIKKIKKGKFELEIYLDEDPINPREDFSFGTMICYHKRYNLGDEKYNIRKFDSWEELATILVDEKKAAVLLPIYMYDHSGISISTSPFGCKWDSGQIGFIYCTKKDMEEYEVDEKKAKELLINEVNDYNQFINGEMYYAIKNKLTKCKCCNQNIVEQIESCNGFGTVDEAIKEMGFEDGEEI